MIKTGVIGNNEFCESTIDKLADIREFRLVGLCKNDAQEFSANFAKHNIKSYNHSEELIKDVDAVIAMPPMSSPEHVVYYVRNSKHVFFELSTDYCKREANMLSAMIDEANVKVQVGFHHRFNNSFLAAKPFIVKPKFIQAGNYRKFSSGYLDNKVLLDMLICDVDIVLSVVNSEVKNVVANAASMHPGTPDVINARIEFHNGCVAQLTAGIIATENAHSFGFYCDKDFINVDLNKNKAWLIKKKNDRNEMQLFQENIGDLCVENINVKSNNYLYDEFSSFAKSIVYDRSPEVSIETTFKTLSVMQTIKEKIKLAIDF
jgi:predicted dehydrogenase